MKDGKGYPIDSLRINITNDKVPDYLLFDESDYNTPILFFDGKTEKRIETEKEIITQFFDFDTIYVDDKKKQNALLVGDGYKDESHYYKILKFDPVSNSMKIIFEYPRLIRNRKGIKEINYIEIVKSKKNIVDTINIFKGELIKSTEETNLNIRPIDKNKSKIFIYNSNKEHFEQKRKVIYP